MNDTFRYKKSMSFPVSTRYLDRKKYRGRGRPRKTDYSNYKYIYRSYGTAT